MSDAALTLTTALVAGMLCPPVVSFLKRENWSNQRKHLVSIVVAFAAAVAGLAVDGSLHWDGQVTLLSLLTLVGLIHGVQQVVYRMYFAGSPWEQSLTAVGTPKPAGTTTAVDTGNWEFPAPAHYSPPEPPPPDA